jgi:hypothetical protein
MAQQRCRVGVDPTKLLARVPGRAVAKLQSRDSAATVQAVSLEAASLELVGEDTGLQ